MMFPQWSLQSPSLTKSQVYARKPANLNPLKLANCSSEGVLVSACMYTFDLILIRENLKKLL